MMQRKMIHGFLAALLVVMQLCTLVGIRHVQAVESPSVEQTLIDSDDLTLKATGVQNGELIDWTLQYERKDSPTQRALKIEVKAEDNTLTPINATDWHQLQAADTQWWQEKDFTTEATGSLYYQTPITQTSLTIMAQLDEQTVIATTEAATEDNPVATEPQLNVDLLDDQVAGPHTVTLTLPEVEQPVPDPEDEAAQAEATEESVVTPTLPAATDEALDTVEQPETKLANDPILEPNQTQTKDASNLVLSLDSLATLAVKTNVGTRYFKGPSNGFNYDSIGNMQTRTSKNYIPNSSSAAVIFSGATQAQRATIDLSYDNVGFAQLTNGDTVKIGARVVVNDIKYRDSDWGTSTSMGMDFSNNFYSGMQLANVRSFDWKVTFFEANDTRAVINFVKGCDARLTFTSLNPGEFVKPHDETLVFSTADPDSVKKTDLHSSRTAPNDGQSAFYNWLNQYGGKWPIVSNPDIKGAYTSHKWGNWDSNPVIDPALNWHDKLGAPTFGNGAAAFALVGSTFTFTRGTYFNGPTTWLANASGDAKFILPKYLQRNKSISALPGQGGGTAQKVNDTPDGEPFTPNELHQTNINELALADQEMYYYINQQTYSLAADLVSLPSKIVITDELPAGMVFANDSDDDVIVFNERTANDGRTRVLEDAIIERNKQHLTVTLPHSVLEKVPFAGGFISIQVRVKTTHDPNTITQDYTMDNKATVMIYGPDENVPVSTEDTKVVSVTVSPNRVDPTFNKVDEYNQPLPGVEFELYGDAQATGDALHRATADDAGQVKFTSVQPGAYWLKESKTPVGYVPLNSLIAITVNSNGTITWPKSWTQGNQVTNKLHRWTIDLDKIDDQEQRLAGAEFTLSKADGTEVAKSTTNGNSVLTFNKDNMLAGDYVLEETEAPTGFEKLKGKFTFTLNLDGTMSDFDYDGDDLESDQYQFDAKNYRLSLSVVNHPVEVPLPVTGGNGIQAIIASAVMMMLLALMLGWHWRKEALR